MLTTEGCQLNSPPDERDHLLDYLDAQRSHVLAALEGLTDAQLRQPVLPSGWTCLGLVRHLTLADERYWFRSIIGGEPLGWFPDEPGADWHVADTEPAAAVVDAYRGEIARSNAIIISTPLVAAPRQRDPRWDKWGVEFPNLRDVMLHMITETAVHAGHLDAARELLDGHQWLVVD